MTKIHMALLGKNIAHSQSPTIYKNLLGNNIKYHLLDYSEAREIPSLDQMFKQHNLSALSITAPYKKHFFDDVSKSETTTALQSINAIAFKDGQYWGINTDYLALVEILNKIIKPSQEVILLGNGSMAFLILRILSDAKIKPVHYTRANSGDLTHLSLKHHSQESLIINTCSRSFCYNGDLPKDSYFFDLNYKLDHHAQNLPKKVKIYQDGSKMLELQARFALSFFGLEK